MENKKRWYNLAIIVSIICIGVFIRTRNLGLLEGKYLFGNDPYLFLRYAQYIVDHGHLMSHDPLRIVPWGVNTSHHLNGVAYAIAYLHKIGKLIVPSLTVIEVVIWYPIVLFALAMIFFFLLAKRLFNREIALLACALLAVVPSFLFRTIAGFADKEPLAILLMFVSFYLYVRGWQSTRVGVRVVLGVLAGMFTGLMGLTWRGVFFVLLTIGLYNCVLLLSNAFREKDYSLYLGWYIPVVLLLSQGTQRYGGLIGVLTSVKTGLLTLFLLVSSIHFVLFKAHFMKISHKLKDRVPEGMASLLAALILIIGGVCIVNGPELIAHKLYSAVELLLYPWGEPSSSNARLASSISELHQPFLAFWWGSFGFLLYLFPLGSIALCYQWLRKMRTYKWTLAAYVFLICSIILTRLSEGSLLDGRSILSNALYLGSFAVFGSVLLFAFVHSFYKDKLVLKGIAHLGRAYLFVLIWLVLTAVAARTARRFFVVVSPIAVMLASYAIIEMCNRIVKRPCGGNLPLYDVFSVKPGRWGMIMILAVSIGGGPPSIAGLAKSSYELAKKAEPNFDQQWCDATEWIRTRTPNDAILAASEWNCGYWIQSIGQRATLLDGSCAQVGVFARRVLCAQSEDEALKYLRGRRATHLLISSRAVRGYSGFSHYGSDKSDDRRSQIGEFELDPKTSRPGHTFLHYRRGGGWPLDRDIVYRGTLYPKARSCITDFFVTAKWLENRLVIGQPIAVVSYEGVETEIPLRSVLIEGKEHQFEEGLEGCLRIIPHQDESEDLKRYGAALYISEKAMRTLWGQLFLLGKESNHFENVYDDEGQRPLAISGEKLVGSLKIWKIHYPDK